MEYKKLRDTFEVFLIFSIMGWLYEVLICNLLVRSTFKNCGFLFGPWLPIYGIGAVVIMSLLHNKKSKGIIFMTGALVSTAIELIGSYFLEFVRGKWLWNYNDLFLNFEGRIALPAAIVFGVLSILEMCYILPEIKKTQYEFDDSIVRNGVTLVLSILFFIDLLSRCWLGSNL